MIILDKNNTITKWVCQKLKEPIDFLDSPFYTIGFYQNKKLVGGLIYHNIRPRLDLWMTIYTSHPSWATKKNLKGLFFIAFKVFKCRRINVLIRKSNQKSLFLCQRLGFQKEGLLRKYLEDKEDAYILGMFENECKYL
jgi:RimJ/RimL family protein N-acetyltransferase